MNYLWHSTSAERIFYEPFDSGLVIEEYAPIEEIQGYTEEDSRLQWVQPPSARNIYCC